MIGVAVLGSTGSIGRQTLEVVARLADRFEVRALASGRPTGQFCRQLDAHPTARAWCAAGRPAELADGRWAADGLTELATQPDVDIVVIATSGTVALPAVLAALEAGKKVALANKEVLVTGGHLVEAALDRVVRPAHRGAPRDPLARLERLRPVDSEHSAIWQCLAGERLVAVRRLILTASGGPFRDRSFAELATITPAEALAHPTWRMGPKVTIDSATLVNKAFEVIEARWLYGVPYSRIAAVLHPASVVHSLVEFVDGSYKAQLGFPDMRLPIQYALTYPERLPGPMVDRPPETWPALEFLPLDETRFPAYRAVREAAAAGGNRGTVVNAADQVAVTAFLEGRLDFDRIGPVIEDALERWGSDEAPDLATLTALDSEIRSRLAAELAA